MKHTAAVLCSICFALFLLAGCGGPTTPDTEGQSLTQARQALASSGVPEGNITVVGERGDPNDLLVCDQDPDGVAPTEPVNIEVATVCAEDDSRKKKRPKVRRRR